MLVLTRMKDETLVINGVVEVTVVRISGKKVRLGIKAPKELKVLRKEIQDCGHKP
jgi:carbon storage regulator